MGPNIHLPPDRLEIKVFPDLWRIMLITMVSE